MLGSELSLRGGVGSGYDPSVDIAVFDNPG